MKFLEQLPEQIYRDILLRVPYKSQPKIKELLKPAKEIMKCSEFYNDRIKFGLGKQYICLLHSAGISIYDPVDQSCEKLAPNPTATEISNGFRIMCVHHMIVLLLWDKHSGANIWVYDLLCGTWRQGAEMPTARAGTQFACCASPEGSLYIAGGHPRNGGDNDGLCEAAIYKVDEDKWERLPDMQEEIGLCFGVFIHGMFYVISTCDCGCQRFDPNTSAWKNNSEYFFARYADQKFAVCVWTTD